MKPNSYTLVLAASVVINLLLVTALCIFSIRYNLVERLMLRTGLKKHDVQRQHEPHYANHKSTYEILPRVESSIVFVGDSLTLACPWAELFRNPRIRNRGIGNECATGILERIDEILSPPPKKIFLQIGLSDMGRYFPTPEILRDYERIIDTARTRAPGVELYIQSVLPISENLSPPPPTNAEIREFNKALASLAVRKGCTYIDLYPLFASANGSLDLVYTNDGVHLNGRGYLRWKGAIEKYVK